MADETDEKERERRRLRERIFGDVLPETTQDERDADDRPASSDEWLRRQVPPHHGT